jgi:hypothetical protein
MSESGHRIVEVMNFYFDTGWEYDLIPFISFYHLFDASPD